MRSYYLTTVWDGLQASRYGNHEGIQGNPGFHLTVSAMQAFQLLN